MFLVVAVAAAEAHCHMMAILDCRHSAKPPTEGEIARCLYDISQRQHQHQNQYHVGLEQMVLLRMPSLGAMAADYLVCTAVEEMTCCLNKGA